MSCAEPSAVVDWAARGVPRRSGCRQASRTPATSGWRRRLIVLAIVLIAAVSPVDAQETGTLRGTVTLVENGEPVDGAVILILGTGAFTFSDNGAFEFTNVPTGEYVVSAQREHLTTEQQPVTVAAGETAGVEFALSLSPVREEVTVTAEATLGAEATLRAFNAVTTLDSFDIAIEAPSSLGEALEDEPGIANRSFGPGSSRPIVRGFSGDRVHIIEDGIPTGDLSSTSDHHGVTIDPHNAERIEIMRGPATLLYGSNIVGLINVITPHAAYRNLLTPPESYGDMLLDGTRGGLGADATSANGQTGTYANLQHSRGNLLFWGSGAYRQAGDYNTPEGSVFNSATELSSGRAGLGYFGDRFFTSLSLTAEESRFGLPFEDRFHSHGDEEEHDHVAHGHEPDDPIEIDLAAQRRVARLDIGFRNIENRFIQGVRTGFFLIDVQDDHVDTLNGIENVDTRFDNKTYMTRTLVYRRQGEHHGGRFGSELRFRNFEATGAEALSPRTEQVSFSVFDYEELTFGRFRMQFGGRLERTDFETAGRVLLPGLGHGREDDHEEDGHDDDHDMDDHDEDGHDDDHDENDHDENGHDDDHGDEGEEHVLLPSDPRDREFLAVSASVGIHADLTDSTAIVANFTHSHRVPAAEELYNFGPHLGNFEIGSPDLEKETMRGLDVSFRQRVGRVQGEANFYVYGIDNFIFGDLTNEIVDNLRILNIEQGDSRFVGFDARGSVRLGGRVWATLGLGYVNATLTTTGEPLPRIPPLRGTLSLEVPLGQFSISPELLFAGRQDRIFRDETETGSYSLFNVDASYIWPRQHLAHVLSFTGYNLTNALYRNHTSFIKDLAPEMGRGIRVAYSLKFF